MEYKAVTDNNIVWLDMEMTGLEPEECHILEIACLVTDKNLNIISNTFHVVINQPEEILEKMNAWCKNHHAKSGLIKESRASRVSLKETEKQLLHFLKKYTSPGGSPLAGNTIYMDKLFLMKYLPEVANYFHYRVIDVSSISELARRWYPDVRSKRKRKVHRAISDIKESIEELKFLQEHIFIPRKCLMTQKRNSRIDLDTQSSDFEEFERHLPS